MKKIELAKLVIIRYTKYMEHLKKFFSNIWAVLAAVFAVVFGILVYEKKAKEAAEAKLENAETSGKSAVIDAKVDNNNTNMDRLNKENEVAKKETKNDSKEDLADFFKKR